MAGSKGLAEQLKKTVDSENVSFFDAARSAGYANVEELSTLSLEKGSYSAFVELHIEQGPILEEAGISVICIPALVFHYLQPVFSSTPGLLFCIILATHIGIVTAIAAPASIKVDFEGNGGHAGAVLMPQR